MNNPMEYFRMGAENRKKNAVKTSIYGHGDEVGPVNQPDIKPFYPTTDGGYPQVNQEMAAMVNEMIERERKKQAIMDKFNSMKINP